MELRNKCRNIVELIEGQRSARSLESGFLVNRSLIEIIDFPEVSSMPFALYISLEKNE